MAVVDINITQVAGTRVCIVNPTQLQPGDKVRWVNTTQDEVVVIFPHKSGLGAHVFCHTVAANDDYRHQAAAGKKNPVGPPETFRYAVFCQSTGRFAVGGSDPEIIVM